MATASANIGSTILGGKPAPPLNKSLKTLYAQSVTIGADPELFLRDKATKKIVGSERVLTNGFLNFTTNKNGPNPYTYPKVVVTDGVQVELHPGGGGSCREGFSGQLKMCFQALAEMLEQHPELELDFSEVVHVTKIELAKLSPKAQNLGCQPSFNFYDPTPSKETDGLKYRKRSAAGHIHLGFSKSYIATTDVVQMCDLIVGIPSVLIDRDPGSAIRRKLYGKAGEYRTPTYGVEYRTLSNFWLRSYQLMSFVFGQAKQAVAIAATKNNPSQGQGYYGSAWNDITNGVDWTKVQKAINKNDADLAWEIFNTHIVPFYRNLTGYSGLSYSNIDHFIHFAKRVQSDGLGVYFPDPPLQHWLALWEPGSPRLGWENFAANVLHPEMTPPPAPTIPLV